MSCKISKKTIYLIPVLFAAIFLPKYFALGIPSFFSFEIGLSNFNPSLNENITASIENVNFDLANSEIKWILNGKTALQGKNENKFSFTAGEVGKQTKLTAFITTPDGENVSKTITLTPSQIDLIWQANTYIPYFYKGKPLPTAGSKIKIAALTNIILKNKKIPRQNLYFKWYLNDELTEEGWGLDSFNFLTGVFNNENNEIKAEISAEQNSIPMQKNITVPVFNPSINFYEYNNIDNDKFEKSLSVFEIPAGEKEKFTAEPFFVPNENINETDYSWDINGIKTAKNPPYNMLNFSSESGTAGDARVSLKIKYQSLVSETLGKFIIRVK